MGRRWTEFDLLTRYSMSRFGPGGPLSGREGLAVVGVGALIGLLVGGLVGAAFLSLVALLVESYRQGVYVTKRAFLSRPDMGDPARWLLLATVVLSVVPPVIVGIVSAIRNLFSRLRRFGVERSGRSAEQDRTPAAATDRAWRHRMPDGWLAANGDRVLPGVRVETEGRKPELATSSLLCDLLDRIGPGSPFVVLTSPGLRDGHIQATKSGGGGWHATYWDSKADLGFEAECDDLATLYEIMVGWADDSGDWRTRLPWEQVPQP